MILILESLEAGQKSTAQILTDIHERSGANVVSSQVQAVIEGLSRERQVVEIVCPPGQEAKYAMTDKGLQFLATLRKRIPQG